MGLPLGVAFSAAASQDDGVAGSERVGPKH